MTCGSVVAPLGPIPTAERIVIDRNRVTAAGVSAGIDCALQLASLLRGQEAAEAMQLQIEYDPQPPFQCGSPNAAPECLVRRLTEASKATLQERRVRLNALASFAKGVGVIYRNTLLHLFDYNYWARDRQLQACAALNEDQFRRRMGSSFSSVQATLAHMVESEWVWSERWYGRSPGAQETREFAPEQFPTVIALRQRWTTVELSVRRYLGNLKEDDLTNEVRYLNRKGEPWAYPLWQALFHLINHQTYHRGQVTTLLRQLGTTPPEVDYLIAYDHGLRASG